MTKKNTVWILAVVASAALAQPPRVDPSPELKRLHFQLGEWETTTETLNKQGDVVSTRRSRAEIGLEHGGLMIHALHFHENDDEPAWRIWQYHDRYDGKLHDVSFDAVGHFEHRVEVTADGDLAFAFPTLQAFQDGVPRNWRKTYSEIAPDSYRVVWDFTEDGSTWTPIFRTTYERAPGQESRVEEEPPSA